MSADGYELLDSGNGRKLERFGTVVLDRPAAQALWRPSRPASVWATADAIFDRTDRMAWTVRTRLPSEWRIALDGLHFRLSATDFGHLGIFPEQRQMWQWIRRCIGEARARSPHGAPSLLNLFAYSGGATLAALAAGAQVCHVDASRGMVQWARQNAALNQLETAPVRWIVDDVHKFLRREARRDRRYHAIVLDPPTFGRGTGGEVYKIERDLMTTLDLCCAVLAARPLFVLLSAHTPGLTPIGLANALRQALKELDGVIACGELTLTGQEGVPPLPSGAWARWTPREARA
ncbi:MAG: class I SAM-dependent methyltransferase [Kiritimatiellae bacterium]|nr:class I SAM-dependent methyltransferase [Kiritimatiellia bacterium]